MLPNHGEFNLSMSESYKVIHIGLDPQSCSCIWCEVEQEDFLINHKFYVIFTGETFNRHIEHVGSLRQDALMLHIYRDVK